MIRFFQTLAAVILTTLLAGVLGGAVGAAVGWLAPGFVTRLLPFEVGNAQKPFPPVEVGFGLGVVSGLFLGVGTGLVLVVVMMIREVLIEQRAIRGNGKSHLDDLVREIG